MRVLIRIGLAVLVCAVVQIVIFAASESVDQGYPFSTANAGSTGTGCTHNFPGSGLETVCNTTGSAITGAGDGTSFAWMRKDVHATIYDAELPWWMCDLAGKVKARSWIENQQGTGNYSVSSFARLEVEYTVPSVQYSEASPLITITQAAGGNDKSGTGTLVAGGGSATSPDEIDSGAYVASGDHLEMWYKVTCNSDIASSRAGPTFHADAYVEEAVNGYILAFDDFTLLMAYTLN